MKKYLLLFGCVCFIHIAKTQVTYTVDSIPFHYEVMDAPTQILSNIDDIYSDNLPIGFQFKFFGIPYDTFLVSSNGDITFNQALAGQFNNWKMDSAVIPSQESTYKNSIMLPHLDFLPTNAGATIRYQLKGTAPYRKLIVSFDSISFFSCTWFSFYGQAILYETTNYIDINIKQKDVCAGWNNGYSILGIEDSSGLVAYSPLGRVGMTQWTAFNEGWRFKPSDAGPEDPHPLTNYLKGRVFTDLNSNCLNDGSEPGIMDRIVALDNGMKSYTDLRGYFKLNVDTGVYNISVFSQPYTESSCSQNSYKVHFTTQDSIVDNLDFPIVNDSCAKLSTTITFAPIQNCHSNRIRINCTNYTTDFALGVFLKVVAPSFTSFTDFNLSPYFNDDSVLKFYVGNLRPGENKIFEFTENFTCSNDTNEMRCYEAIYEGLVSNCDTIGGHSYSCNFGNMTGKSPNSMEVMRMDHKELGFVKYGNYTKGERVDYKINFTNQLDTIAKDILIENTIDTTVFDLKTFAFQGATNRGILIPNGNQFQYLMSGINLPSYNTDHIKSQGSLRYSIQIKNDINPNKIVANNSMISFNNKPSTSTNECALFPETKSNVPITTDYFVTSPNPFSYNLFLNIYSYKQYDYAEIYNLIGQRVFKQTIHSSYEILNLDHLQAGIYSIKLYSLTGDILTKRFIKN